MLPLLQFFSFDYYRPLIDWSAIALADSIKYLILPLAVVYVLLDAASQFASFRNLLFKFIPRWVHPRVCTKCLKSTGVYDSPTGNRLSERFSAYSLIVEGSKSLCILSLISIYYQRYVTATSTPNTPPEDVIMSKVRLASWSTVLVSCVQSTLIPSFIHSNIFGNNNHRNCGISRASIHSLISFGILTFANAHYRLYLVAKSPEFSNTSSHTLTEVLLIFAFIIFSSLTSPPLSASSPCADKSSPSYIIKNASPLSRLFSLWFYDFASNIKKDQELDPKDFPLDDEAIEADENLKKEASQAYIKQPFLLSNKLWFFWSIIRPFKWCFAERITLSVFSTIISLSRPLTIHWLLINIENERDLRVLVPESMWLILSVFLRNIMSKLLSKAENSYNVDIQKRLEYGLRGLLMDIAIEEKQFCVVPPTHYKPNDKSKTSEGSEDDKEGSKRISVQGSSWLWKPIAWIKSWFIGSKSDGSDDNDKEDNLSRDVDKSYDLKLHVGQSQNIYLELYLAIENALEAFTNFMTFVSSFIMLYMYIGHCSLVIFLTSVSYLGFFWLRVYEFRFTKEEWRINRCKYWLRHEIINNIRTIKLFGWNTRSIEVLEYLNERARQIWNSKSDPWYFRYLCDIVDFIHDSLTLTYYCLVLGNPLTASLFFTLGSITQNITSFIHDLTPYRYHNFKQGYKRFCDLRVSLMSKRMLVSRENYHCSGANDDSTTKEQNIDNDGSDISLAIRGDADFVWNLPTVDPEKWIVDDVKGTVMLPEPFRKDVDLTKLDTDIIEYCKTTVDLKEINTEIPLGKSTLIAGPTGSGKTSLIKALMGEMCCLKGEVSFPHYQNHGHDNNGRRWEVGYVSQSPWLQNATIRENVLFGSELDVDRYKRVLYACALNQDIESFPDLDQSLIGERGIVLSGGQKQRLSMARALYSQASILIFDDCLSAVDAQTAQHLLTYCISPTSELIKGRTVIVISNQTSMCAPMADKAILMKEGRIEAQGTIKELVAKNHIEMDISQDQQADSNNKDNSVADGDKILDSYLDSFKISPIDQEAPDINLPINESLKSEKNIDVYSLSMLQTLYKFSGTSLKSWTTYLIVYILCAGFVILGDMIFTFVPIESIGTITSGVMTFFALNSLFSLFGNMGWSYSSRIHGKLRDSYENELQRMIGTRIVNAEPVYFDSTPKKEIFTAFNERSQCLAQNVINNINQFLRMMSTTTLTGILLLGSYPLFSVPLALCGACFYKVQQVFLRFKSHADDMEVKHKVGKYRYISEMSSGLNVIRAFGRQHEFMENFEKQKKASGRLNECVSLGYKWKDSINSIIYPALNCALTSMFMGLALSDVSGLSILQLLRISQSTVPSGSDYSPSSMNQETILERAIDTGVLGFMLTRIFILTVILRDIISFGSKIDETAGDIKKFFNYLNLPQEGVNRLLDNDKALDETWPQKGEIVIRDFSTSYDKHVHWLTNLPSKKDKSNAVKDKDQNPDAAPDTVIEKPHNLEPRLTLDHISFTIKGGERVGIVGRTGSGKSTLVLSLFNFLKAKSGSIEIDGVDISKIGLEDLRNKMSVITQDPSVFEADVRFNIDPFGDHSDEEILRVLDALELCEMPKPKVKGKSKDKKDADDSGSDSGSDQQQDRSSSDNDSSSRSDSDSSDTVKEEDKNDKDSKKSKPKRPFRKLEDMASGSLNSGHQQLISLARALIRKSRILVLDEPTASLDYQIDQKIQKVLRGELTKGATVLCVAHRLKTVVDYDRILVVDKGKIVEFDTPGNLLNDPGTMFYKMCIATKDFESLVKAANSNNNGCVDEAVGIQACESE